MQQLQTSIHVHDIPLYSLSLRGYTTTDFLSPLNHLTMNCTRHRATTVDQKSREAKLNYFVEPLVTQWHTPSLSAALSSFTGFCELLGLGSLQQYALSRSMHRIQDWSTHPLDEEGRALQSRVQSALEVKTVMGVKS